MAMFVVLGTLKHAQIAAVQWNREAIARIKAGVSVYSTFLRFTPCFWPVTGSDGFPWPCIGTVPQPGKDVVTHYETSMQEVEQLHD
jgi:hypothetical protein